jgi:IS605 OrfB family transposase
MINEIICIQDFITLIKDDKCVPFWNDNINCISNQIFFPSDDNLIKLNNPKTFNYTSCFQTEHYKSKSDNLVIETNNNRKFNNTIKCKKIKIYFNKKQKIVINKLFGIYRYFYNRAIQYINNYNKENQETYYLINYNDILTKKIIKLDDTKYIFSLNKMRKSLKDNLPEWIDIKYPSHLVDKAFDEAIKNYNICMIKYKKYHIKFCLKFKTKKDKYQTMNIEKTMISNNRKSIFPKLKYENECVFKNIKFSEKLYNDICDSSITCNIKLNKYYLNMSYEDTIKKNEEILKIRKVCSIDPGIRSFLTIYSDNEINKIGINISDKLNKYCKEIDIITSKIYSKKEKKYIYNNNKRKNLKKALHRKIKKIENIKEELHNKSIKFLSERYSKIILPPFEIQKMSNKLNTRISRSLYNLSFYKFKTKLINKCKELNIEFVERPEYYTSKTCTNCGFIKHDLGSNKIFKCLNCNKIIDRDVNGSRNIMLRNNNWEIPPLAIQTV